MQVASDPVWTGDSNDMQVLMSRTVNVDEEELLLATNERASKPLKNATKVRAAVPLLIAQSSLPAHSRVLTDGSHGRGKARPRLDVNVLFNADKRLERAWIHAECERPGCACEGLVCLRTAA